MIADYDALPASPSVVSAQCTIGEHICQRPSPDQRISPKHSPPLQEIWVASLTMTITSWILLRRAVRGPPSTSGPLAPNQRDTSFRNDQPGSNAQKGRSTDATSARLCS